MVQLTFVFLRVIFRGSPAFRFSHVLTKDSDSADSARPLHYSKSDSRLTRAPALSPYYSITHTHRSIGYRNRNPQLLSESAARLMDLRVYDNRDTLASLHPPRPYDPRSHMHTGPLVIATAQPLAESTSRLMYLRVYDSRDSSHQPAPSPSLCYSLTHAHSTLPTPTLLTITCTQVLWFLERLTRPTVSCCETTRTRLTICLPAQPSVCEAF